MGARELLRELESLRLTVQTVLLHLMGSIAYIYIRISIESPLFQLNNIILVGKPTELPRNCQGNISEGEYYQVLATHTLSG